MNQEVQPEGLMFLQTHHLAHITLAAVLATSPKLGETEGCRNAVATSTGVLKLFGLEEHPLSALNKPKYSLILLALLRERSSRAYRFS